MSRATVSLRSLALAAPVLAAVAAVAQDAAAVAATPATSAVNPLHWLVGAAVLQALVIAALGNILSTMGGNSSAWVKALSKTGSRGIVLPLFLSVAVAANAQEFRGTDDTIATDHLVWILVLLNAFLFAVIAVQLLLLRQTIQPTPRGARPYLCPETFMETTRGKRKSQTISGSTKGATKPPEAASTCTGISKPVSFSSSSRAAQISATGS